LQYFEIPLAIPEFPLTSADIDALQSDADWIAFYTQLETQINAIGEPRTPQERRLLSRLATQRALIGGIGMVRSQLHTPQNKSDYQLYVSAVCGALHTATSPFYTENPVYLVIEEASFRIPFDDPANLALQGKARFAGDFTEDEQHPLHWLGGIELGLGISPETIFFAFESDEPIPLPDFGRYHGGSLHLARSPARFWPLPRWLPAPGAPDGGLRLFQELAGVRL
jgi:hypothetical protein